jgi:hypothetical protein
MRTATPIGGDQGFALAVEGAGPLTGPGRQIRKSHERRLRVRLGRPADMDDCQICLASPCFGHGLTKRPKARQ